MQLSAIFEADWPRRQDMGPPVAAGKGTGTAKTTGKGQPDQSVKQFACFDTNH